MFIGKTMHLFFFPRVVCFVCFVLVCFVFFGVCDVHGSDVQFRGVQTLTDCEWWQHQEAKVGIAMMEATPVDVVFGPFSHGAIHLLTLQEWNKEVEFQRRRACSMSVAWQERKNDADDTIRK